MDEIKGKKSQNSNRLGGNPLNFPCFLAAFFGQKGKKYKIWKGKL